MVEKITDNALICSIYPLLAFIGLMLAGFLGSIALPLAFYIVRKDMTEMEKNHFYGLMEFLLAMFILTTAAGFFELAMESHIVLASIVLTTVMCVVNFIFALVEKTPDYPVGIDLKVQ